MLSQMSDIIMPLNHNFAPLQSFVPFQIALHFTLPPSLYLPPTPIQTSIFRTKVPLCCINKFTQCDWKGPKYEKLSNAGLNGTAV